MQEIEINIAVEINVCTTHYTPEYTVSGKNAPPPLKMLYTCTVYNTIQ